MRAVVSQPVSLLDTLPPGQTAAIITVTANTLQLGISEQLSTFLQSLSLVVSAMVLSFYYNWKLTLVAGAGVLAMVASYAITTPIIVKNMNRVADSEIHAATVANEIFSSVRMIAAYGAETKMMKRFGKWADESRDRGRKLAPVYAFQYGPGT